MSSGEDGGAPELELEHEAAALMQAWAQQAPVAVPSALQERIQREGSAMVSAKHSTDAVPVTKAARPDTGRPLFSFVGGFAMAAGLTLAALVGFNVFGPTPGNETGGPVAIDSPTPTPDPTLTAADFDRLLADANRPDAVNVAAFFQPGSDAPADASGEVVWLAEEQRSVLRLRGLQPNDPAQSQYQLWVVDPTRDAKHPVDGGVFDIGDDGVMLVALDAKLPVDRPTVFAITREQPGGVVVSDGPMLLVAQVPQDAQDGPAG